ncbi:MAG: DUF1573 domain-containing protein [Bacteroidales bacterium]|nr:DUF1573 domain-containing protein [Bacteroidales bacterium]
MKKVILMIFMAFVAVTAFADRRVPGDKVGVSIDTLVYEFGTVKANGPAVTHIYRMKVTGKQPVSIIQAVPSCGCTTPEYPRRPLKPGETADIKVVYDPKGQKGEQDKEVRLRVKNADGKAENISLRLTGMVVPK